MIELALIVIYLVVSAMSWSYLNIDFPEGTFKTIMTLIFLGWLAIICAIFKRIFFDHH